MTKSAATKTRKPRSDKGKPRGKIAVVVAAAVAEAKADNRKSIVPKKYKVAYAQHKDTCGDKLALALKAATTVKNEDGRDCLDVPALAAIAAANGVDFSRYEHLNNGQKRMNVANVMRNMVRDGARVQVGKLVWNKSA